jgi:hypothetical protein
MKTIQDLSTDVLLNTHGHWCHRVIYLTQKRGREPMAYDIGARIDHAIAQLDIIETEMLRRVASHQN